MPTLFEIADELLALLQLAEGSGGEITPDVNTNLEEWFASIEQQQEAKIQSYLTLVREQQLQAAAIGEEIERLKKRQQSRLSLAQRLKDRLREYMETTGQQRIACERFTVSISRNGGKQPVEVVSIEQLPPGFVKNTPAPDLDLIRKWLEEGKAVPGCKLLPRGHHLKIS